MPARAKGARIATTAKPTTKPAKPAKPTKPEKPARPSRAKPDALELWSHPGELATAMRNAAFKMTAEAYAATSMDTCLQGDGVAVRIVDGARVYAHAGKDFATLRIDDKTLVLQFVAPTQSDELARVAGFYRAVPGRAGWLEFRRPATRDPRPGLDANVGSLLGRAAFERRQ